MLTRRAIVIGLVLTALISAFTPYNDWIIYNTLATAGFFPPAVVICLFILVLLVNAPLHALRPSAALRSGELVVILAILLTGCAVPGQGLMRALPATLVSPLRFAGTDSAFQQVWLAAGVPQWLFPVSGDKPWLSRVVTEIYARTPPGSTPPYSAWVLPLLIWSIPLAAMYAILLSIASLLRAQWAENERLTFPLVQLEAALIEEPSPGRWVNDLMRRRSFWIALLGVLILHSLNALHTYFPRYVPLIPLNYDLRPVLTTEPFNQLPFTVTTSTLFFTVVGIMYFVPGRVGLSLWLVFALFQAGSLVYTSAFQQNIPQQAWFDQHFGASVGLLLSVAWVGRQHWARVIRHLFRGPDRGDLTNYRTPALFLLGGCAVMLAWLLLAGAGLVVSLLIVACLLLANVAVTRVVCETGLPIFRVNVVPSQIVYNLPESSLSSRQVFWTAAGGILMGGFNTRESATTLSLNALRLADLQSPAPTPRQRSSLMKWIACSIAIAFVFSSASWLYCYYHYATPLSTRVQIPVINDHLLLILPKSDIVDPMVQHAQGHFLPKNYDPWGTMIVGTLVFLGLQIATWTWAWWPIAPIGFLIGSTQYMHQVWFSVVIGWALKAILVSLGGAPMYRSAKPFFVGLIFGEGAAASLWLIVSVVLSQAGMDYQQIRLLPG
jgi:hypothetical protein